MKALTRFFERFYRVDKSHSREIGGTGLGLAITRSAIVMHRGAIKVKSEEHKGTTFFGKNSVDVYRVRRQKHEKNADGRTLFF